MSKTLPLMTPAAAATRNLDGSEQVLVSQGGNPRRSTALDVAGLAAQAPNAPALNLMDYIPQSEWAAIRNWTSTYDCLAAMNAAIADLFHLNPALGGGVAGGKIVIPAGHYQFSNTININEVFVHLQGAGAGEAGASVTVLIWPTDVTGIHVYHDDVSLGSGSASRFDGLYLRGAQVNGGVGHGFDCGERVEIMNCVVEGFSANGINMIASVPGGNANDWLVEKVRLVANRGHGMLVYGTDVNAGVGIGISASGNTGFGIYDSSFLGNTYVGCHTEDNVAGAYKDDNANARNVWLGCYSEGGQPPSSFQAASYVIGGIHAAGFTTATSAFLLCDERSPWTVSRTTGLGSVAGLQFQYGINGSATVLVDNAGGNAIIGMYDVNTGCWADCGDYSPQYQSLLRTSNNNVIKDFDTSTTIGHGATIYPSERYVRNATGTAKLIRETYLPAAPSGAIDGGATPTGQAWKVGDIVWNTAPVAGGFVGWVCTTAGVVGSGGVFKTFGPISA